MAGRERDQRPGAMARAGTIGFGPPGRAAGCRAGGPSTNGLRVCRERNEEIVKRASTARARPPAGAGVDARSANEGRARGDVEAGIASGIGAGPAQGGRARGRSQVVAAGSRRRPTCGGNRARARASAPRGRPSNRVEQEAVGARHYWVAASTATRAGGGTPWGRPPPAAGAPASKVKSSNRMAPGIPGEPPGEPEEPGAGCRAQRQDEGRVDGDPEKTLQRKARAHEGEACEERVGRPRGRFGRGHEPREVESAFEFTRSVPLC